MAVGTGFAQLFRSVGQVGAFPRVFEAFSNHHLVQVGVVAISSAVFQSILDRELGKRIHGSDANEVSQSLYV